MSTTPIKKSSRILSFDLLRGYFLIVILCNHLYFYPSGLDIITGRGGLYASSAEGFFLISGIMLGIVRGRKLLDKPFAFVTKLLLKRSVQLYLTMLFVTFTSLLLGWWFIDNPGVKTTLPSPSIPWWQLLWEFATFQTVYGWADFLRQYALFLAVAPLAVFWLRRGQWLLVLVTSFMVWLLFPYTEHGYIQHPYSWQLIFFVGLVVGFYWQQLTAWWNKFFSPATRDRTGVSLVILTIITAIISAVLVFGHKFGLQTLDIHHTIEEYFSKDRLPLPRLALGTLWFFGLLWLFRRYEKLLVRKLGWLLLTLGQNSLYVYTIQAYIVYFIHLFVLNPKQASELHLWYLNLAVTLFALAIVWYSTHRKFLFKIIPR